MSNPFDIVRTFEREVADYAGSRYAVAVASCTDAIFLCLKYYQYRGILCKHTPITIPNRTYISVPMQITNAGLEVKFRDEEWEGYYKLEGTDIYDSARLLTSGIYEKIKYENEGIQPYICTSHHRTKHLSTLVGGCILHNDSSADQWFRKARFDGRTEGVPPSEDIFDILGYHCYMIPELAAHGLCNLTKLPRHNKPLPNDNYPDLSKIGLFRS